MKASFCNHGVIKKFRGLVDHINRGLDPSHITSTTTHPITIQHPSRDIHPNRSDHTRLGTQETMIEQCHFHEELGQSPGLNVVVIRFGDPADPAVRRAVRGDVKVEGLAVGGGEVSKHVKR
jgi:hypothetical protein